MGFVKRRDNWTLEKVTEELLENWEVLSYEDPLLLRTVITCRCKHCNKDHSVRLKKFLDARITRTHGCPNCHENYMKSKQFSEERSVVAVGFMSRSENRSKWSSLLKDRWISDKTGMIETCTGFNSGGRSLPELELEEWIRSFGIETYHGHSCGMNVDIVVPSKKIHIEFNGLYWHCEAHKPDRTYHLNKTRISEKNGYRMIHVWSDQWKYRNRQVKNFLLSALGLNSVKIGARRCEFRSIDKELGSSFLEETHIQGKALNILYCLGAFYKGDLISVCSFSRHHRNNTDVVLSRLAFKEGVTVSGALSKFSSLASDYFKKDLITWVHRSLSSGDSYLKSGWITDEVIRPDYQYTDGKAMFSKQSRRKSNVHTPEDMTEQEHALAVGLLRIWDCGKIRFRYPFLPSI